MSPSLILLVYVVLPLWIAAGFADSLCHAASHIAQANGVRENLLHWAGLSVIGLPVLAAVFLQVNALLFVFMVVCLIVHEIITHRDIRLAQRTRVVMAFEQQVHSVLEMAPLAGLLLLATEYWPQAQAIVGAGSERAQWDLRWKDVLPGVDDLLIPFAAIVLLIVLPYAHETWRGLRTARSGQA